METRNQAETRRPRPLVDARRHPRFNLNVEISVYSRTCGLIRGHTVDISESGISAMFKIEVPVGETVQMEFTLPLGPVKVLAMVRQRNAFRYGFEFVEASYSPELKIVRRTCRELAVKNILAENQPPGAMH